MVIADIRITRIADRGQLHRYARQRLARILSDRRSGLEAVSVSIDMLPAGGPESFSCRILARVSSRLSLSVERVGATAHAAIDAAADRLGWALGILHGGLGTVRGFPPLAGRPSHDEGSTASEPRLG